MLGEQAIENSRRNALIESYWALAHEGAKLGFSEEVHDYPRQYIHDLESHYGKGQIFQTELSHRLIGSTPAGNIENFDLPNGEFEKFITDLFPKYIESLKNL